MSLFSIHHSWQLRLVLVCCVIFVSSCKDESTSQATAAKTVLSQIDITNYVLVSSRRVGRTVSEYTLRAVATNQTSTRYTNVSAILTSTPSNVTVVDGSVIFGTLNANASINSADEFVIAVDLSVKTSLDALIWEVSGTPPTTGGGGNPAQPGIFMSIDENAVIKGESTSPSHLDWIELTYFREGSKVVIGDAVGGTRTTSRVAFDGVTVGKYMDISSPLLRRALTDGDVFGEVKIDVIYTCDATTYTAYAITLTVSVLTELSLSATELDTPTENLAFNYSRIETMFTPVGPSCILGTPIYSFQDIAGFKL